MDPKRAAEILAKIDAVVGELNTEALCVYATLLKRCGVQTPRIFRAFFLP